LIVLLFDVFLISVFQILCVFVTCVLQLLSMLLACIWYHFKAYFMLCAMREIVFCVIVLVTCLSSILKSRRVYIVVSFLQSAYALE
jgi:hypothetical protein